jgi:hypothetical protein
LIYYNANRVNLIAISARSPAKGWSITAATVAIGRR